MSIPAQSEVDIDEGLEEEYSEDFDVSLSHSEKVTSAFSEEDEHQSKTQDNHRMDSPRQVRLEDPSQHSQLSEGVPDELKGLTRYFEGDDASEDVSISVSQSQGESQDQEGSISRESRRNGKSADESSIENILEKLNRLSNAQLALENALEAEGKMDEGTLNDALKQARLHIPVFNSDQVEEDEQLSLSLSAEMDALKNLTEGKRNYDDAILEERDVQQIFKQYDELEKSLARSRYADRDGQESNRNNNTGVLPTARPVIVPSSISGPGPLVTQTLSTSSGQQRISQPSSLDPYIFHSSSSTQNVKAHSSNSGPTVTQSASFVPNTRADLFRQPNSSQSMSSSSSLTITEDLGPCRTKQRPTDRQYREASASQHVSYLARPKSRTGIPNPVDTPPTSPMKSAQNYLKESVSAPGLGRERPITPNSPFPSRSSRTIKSPIRKFSGRNQQSPAGNGGRGEELQLQEEYLLKIQKLEAEKARQETLIDAFQQDNQKLYTELKINEKEHSKKEAEWEDITNSLKTEIATLKINRLAPFTGSPARPGSAQRAELDRIRDESTMKSQQITELRREILVMRNNMAETSKPAAAKQGRAAIISQEREKESQKTIRSLTKQVRTLQKILYSRDPLAAAALAKASSRDDLNLSQERLNSVNGDRKDSHVCVLEARIIELETDLGRADEEARNRLKDFQARLGGLKGKYEDQIKEYEMRLEEAACRIDSLEGSVAQATIQEFKNRYDKSQAEVCHLKQEISRFKRELEIAQKSSMSTAVSQASAKQDAGTLSLAIKSFKSELSEKEKEIIRMKKEIADLNRTNTSLKRDREKCLNLANVLSIPGNSSLSNNPRIVHRTKSDLNKQGPKLTKDIGSTKPLSPRRGPTNASQSTNQMLQSALEYERTEFEQIIDQKKKELQERDQIIKRLKRELEDSKDSNADEEDESSRSFILNELRSRVATQNELIQKLKDHIAHYRRIEGEYLLLKQENGQAEVQIKELKQKLELSQTLTKPENEVLELLSKKFDELNSRYLNRESQMVTLLNRLTVQTGSNYLSPRLALSSGSNLDAVTRPLEFDLRQLSPTISMHLLNASPDTQ